MRFFIFGKGKKMWKEYLECVRKQAPIIHNITNYVTANDVANVLLACGASPIMAEAPEEVAEITSVCSGLNLNMGTLSEQKIEAMFLAGMKANELGHPVLLDPVGVGASQFRSKAAEKLQDVLTFSVIRGNISEIKHLSAGTGHAHGVDADLADAVTEENLEQAIAFVKTFARTRQTIVVVTGKIDLISDGTQCAVVRNGSKLMNQVTGMGCMLSGILTAYLAAQTLQKSEKSGKNEVDMECPRESSFWAAVAAVAFFGVAGELAEEALKVEEGSGMFRVRFIDAIGNLTGETLEECAKIELR